MKLKQTKTWNIVKEAFLKEWGYNIKEHPSYNLVKFLVKQIEEEKEDDFKNIMDSKKM